MNWRISCAPCGTTQQRDCKIRPFTTHSRSTHTAWLKNPAKLHAHGYVLDVPCLRDSGFVCCRCWARQNNDCPGLLVRQDLHCFLSPSNTVAIKSSKESSRLLIIHILEFKFSSTTSADHSVDGIFAQYGRIPPVIRRMHSQ